MGRRIKKHGNSFANTNVEGGEPDKDIVVCKNISASDCKNISELHWTTWPADHVTVVVEVFRGGVTGDSDDGVLTFDT